VVALLAVLTHLNARVGLHIPLFTVSTTWGWLRELHCHLFPHNINLGATFNPGYSPDGLRYCTESADLATSWVFALVI
jgi:hypothetical protein